MPRGFDGGQKVFDTRIIRITGPDVVDPYDLVDSEAGGSARVGGMIGVAAASQMGQRTVAAPSGRVSSLISH